MSASLVDLVAPIGANWNNFVSWIYALQWKDEPLIKSWGWPLPLVTCAFYMLFVVYLGPKLMANRPALNLKWPMFIWNFFLFLFSVYCSLGFVWRLYVQSQKHGSEVLLCDTHGRLWEGIDLFYVWIFLISKFIELGDTVFLVLRKSNVIFLHWYHHVTVLLYCWHANDTHSSNSILFGTMNAWVHAIMYFYYSLTSLDLRPTWGEWVTRLQLSQMFFGILFSSIWAYQHYFENAKCYSSDPSSSVLTAVLMYGSYFALFLQFYIARWIDNKRKARAARAAQVSDKETPKKAPATPRGKSQKKDETPKEAPKKEPAVKSEKPATPRGRGRPKKE